METNMPVNNAVTRLIVWWGWEGEPGYIELGVILYPSEGDWAALRAFREAYKRTPTGLRNAICG
jgi:hypothetical protein